MTNILVGIPCGGTVKAQLLTTVVSSIISTEVQMTLMVRESALGPDNRWHMARAAADLANEFTHLWLVDNDMAFPSDTLARLLAHDKDIVGAAYNYRALPLRTVVKMLDAEGNVVIPKSLPKSLFKAHATGSGCSLVKVEALRRIPQPWFALDWWPDGALKVTDDVWFSQQARKVGIDTWCDPTINAKHIGDMEF